MSHTVYKILSFGCEVQFLKLREKQLQHAGFHVDSVLSLEDALTLMGRKHYDLAIVGHAVSENERNRLAGALKIGDGPVPVIFLYHHSIRNAAQADAVLSVMAEPRDLVAAAQRLIHRNSSAPRAS